MKRFGLFTTALLGVVFLAEAWARDEIVVSVRKRAENLQDVPVAVSAITADDLQKLNISDVADITKYQSSLIFSQGFAAQDTRVTIRGLAPTRGRQNVAVLVDDIDISNQPLQTNGSGLLLNPRLFDTERVEIVKGPQNALYGRTAFAGAINYITKKPGEEFEGSIATDIGSEGNLDLRAGVSGPLGGDTLLGGLNVATWQNDGFHNNSVTGDEVGGTDGYGVAGTLTWKASDAFSATVRAEYTDDDIDQAPYFAVIPTVPTPVPASALGTVISPTATSVVSVDSLPDGDDASVTLWENPRTGSDYPGVEREVLRGTLTLDYDFGPVSLKSLTHLADSEIFSFEDARREGTLDPMAAENFARGEFLARDENKLLSQELRLQSNADGPVNWTVGALYWEENTDFFDGGINCIQQPGFIPGVGPIPGIDCGDSLAALFPDEASLLIDTWERDTEHWSVYGLVEWQFVEDWSLILEARYTDEELTVSGPDRGNDPMSAGPPRPRAFDSRNGPVPPPGGFPGMLFPAYGQLTDQVDDDFFAPKATLQWDATDDAMVYFSVAQAYKPAGISVVAALTGFNRETSRFEQEELIVYELGGKSEWLDGRLTLNGALFFQDFTDKQTSSQQVTASNTLAAIPVNASAAEVLGLELDLSYRPTDNLDLYLSYTYLDTEYTDFKINNGGIARIAEAGNCTPVTLAMRTTCEIDLSGNELEGAPENSLLVGFGYSRPFVDDFEWFLEGDLIFQDDRFTNNANTIVLDSYSLVDFRLGISNEQWEALAYVNNAFDDDTIKSSNLNTYNAGIMLDFGPPFTFILPLNQTPIKPDGRSIGVRVAYRFGM